MRALSQGAALVVALLAMPMLTAPLSAQTAAPADARSGTPAAEAAMTESETQRLKQLSAELRCLVCQNQSLADSNAELAVDLRNQVRDQIRAGRDDEQIKDYLVQRYGDFVLYRPRMSATTVLLWAGPFALLLLGGVVMWRYLRRRALIQGQVQMRVSDDATADGEQLARARALLRGDDPAVPGAERRP